MIPRPRLTVEKAEAKGVKIVHIPDGYLSPQTCLVLGGAAAPVCWRALERVRRETGERGVPAVALSAAFAFTVQMLNVPVPDGTTAHATGAALAAIALGPWAAVVSLTVALVLQAFIFADGGILALGANVLNMAILEPVAAYWVYRWLFGRDGDPRRRSWAAAAGAYVGINLAALATGVELGLQPLLFHAPDGTPLYAPYPLGLAVPAMAYAHLLVAGPLEAVVTGMALTFLIRSGYALPGLRAGEGGKAVATPGGRRPVLGSGRLGRAWWLLGGALLATPLGLVAAGTAWGEWGLDELRARLGYVPPGMARLAGWWRGLLPDYAVPGLSQGAAAVLGYWAAALLGIGLVLLAVFLLFRLAPVMRTGVVKWFRHG